MLRERSVTRRVTAHVWCDVTGLNKSSGSERESLTRRAGHADEKVQAGADRDPTPRVCAAVKFSR